MPLHFHPVLRALEEALETDGLIKTLDSVGVARKKDAESASAPGYLGVKLVPVNHKRVIRGTQYVAS